MDVDIADQRDFHGGLLAHDLLADRSDVRGCRYLGVGKVEIERGIEEQRELLLVQDRRDADAIGHFEHEANEGRLHQCANANRRSLLRSIGGAPDTQGALGRPRPLCQFLDHVGREARRRAGPAIGQQIDEDPLARRHGVDGDPA